jgi:hypothetical protein
MSVSFAFESSVGKPEVYSVGHDATLPPVRLALDSPGPPGAQRELSAVPGRPEGLPQLQVSRPTGCLSVS